MTLAATSDDEADLNASGAITVIPNGLPRQPPEQTGPSPGALSGTTARASMNSNTAVDIAHSAELLYNLVDLNDVSTRMLSILAPNSSDLASAVDSVRRNFSDERSAAGRLISSKRKVLETQWQLYAGTEDLIDVPTIVRCMLHLSDDSQLPIEKWRPDDVLFRANVARAAENLYKSFREDESLDLPWDRLHQDFPRCFLNSVYDKAPPMSYGRSQLFDQTFLMALLLRTHFFVQTLQTNVGTSVEVYLDEVFGAQGEYKGWDVHRRRAEDLLPKHIQEIDTRKRTLEAEVSSQAQDDDSALAYIVQILEQQYPAKNFVHNYLRWLRRRSGEIDNALSRVGGILAIQEAVEVFTTVRRDEILLQEKKRIYLLDSADRKARGSMLPPAAPSPQTPGR